MSNTTTVLRLCCVVVEVVTIFVSVKYPLLVIFACFSRYLTQKTEFNPIILDWENVQKLLKICWNPNQQFWDVFSVSGILSLGWPRQLFKILCLICLRGGGTWCPETIRRRQCALRQSAPETMCPGDNMPRDNLPRRLSAPETTCPGEYLPRETTCLETICPGD